MVKLTPIVVGDDRLHPYRVPSHPRVPLVASEQRQG